ncbi:MAG: (2Fe-2S) ferredoxin domain-containing protein [Cyanobacteria bacterium P01_C01_bin.69]
MKLQISSNVISETLPNMVSEITLDAKSDSSPSIPWMFNLEGTFLGLLGEPPEKVTAIALEVDQERICIELPENLRNAVKHAVRRHTLRLGDRVSCIGRSRLNFSASIIQLKAYCLFTDRQSSRSPLFNTHSFNNTQPQNLHSQNFHQKDNQRDKLPTFSQPPAAISLDPNSPQDKIRGKIMVCHKSGCKKRGGKQLVAALEKAIRERHLENIVELQYTGCQKQCSRAPGLMIMPGNYRYSRINPVEVPALLEKHFPQPTF